MSKWLDQKLVKTQQELAGQHSRRSFLGRVGSGAVALMGGGLVLSETREAEAFVSAYCYGTIDVDLCWSPWVVNRAEPGQTDRVIVRKGPSFSAPPVYSSTGEMTHILVGKHFGRQSKRDGGSGCPDPGPRANVNGWLYGYPGPDMPYRSQGWIPYNVGGVVYASGDNGYTGRLCGPAGVDFDCRYPGGGGCNYNGCNTGQSQGTCSGNDACWRIKDSGSNVANSNQMYYLRYAANSTSIYWLIPGDVVERYCYKDTPSGTWSCIRVACAKWAPAGCKGWIDSSALTGPITCPADCSPQVSIPCTNGVT